MAVYLNGQGIPDLDTRGQRVYDDSFLLCFNAHHEAIDLAMPASQFAAGWTVVLDTAHNAADSPITPGGTVCVAARSLVVLQGND